MAKEVLLGGRWSICLKTATFDDLWGVLTAEGALQFLSEKEYETLLRELEKKAGDDWQQWWVIYFSSNDGSRREARALKKVEELGGFPGAKKVADWESQVHRAEESLIGEACLPSEDIFDNLEEVGLSSVESQGEEAEKSIPEPEPKASKGGNGSDAKTGRSKVKEVNSDPGDSSGEFSEVFMEVLRHGLTEELRGRLEALAKTEAQKELLLNLC